MAAVTANTVFCRAPVASARAPRAAGASAARAGALPARTAARVALAQGSPLAPYALGVAAPAARAARVPALRAHFRGARATHATASDAVSSDLIA